MRKDPCGHAPHAVALLVELLPVISHMEQLTLFVAPYRALKEPDGQRVQFKGLVAPGSAL